MWAEPVSRHFMESCIKHTAFCKFVRYSGYLSNQSRDVTSCLTSNSDVLVHSTPARPLREMIVHTLLDTNSGVCPSHCAL